MNTRLKKALPWFPFGLALAYGPVVIVCAFLNPNASKTTQGLLAGSFIALCAIACDGLAGPTIARYTAEGRAVGPQLRLRVAVRWMLWPASLVCLASAVGMREAAPKNGLTLSILVAGLICIVVSVAGSAYAVYASLLMLRAARSRRRS